MGESGNENKKKSKKKKKKTGQRKIRPGSFEELVSLVESMKASVINKHHATVIGETVQYLILGGISSHNGSSDSYVDAGNNSTTKSATSAATNLYKIYEDARENV